MASISGVVKLGCLILACMVVAAPHAAEAAVSCNQVRSQITPCISYLRTGGQVPAPCCNGVKSITSSAKTTADRRAICSCLKSAYASTSGIQLGFVSSLPGKCGVTLPYTITPSIDCSKVL